MGVYDNLRNALRGDPTTNNSNWKANIHKEENEEQSSLSGSFARIKDSIARSNEYGAPGHGYQGTSVNGKLAVSRAEAEAMSSAEYEAQINEEYEAQIAELLGQGITRQGGNY